MKIGIFHVDTHTLDAGCGYLCAAALTRSIRQHMPKVQVLHFTDEQSAAIEGVDGVVRKPKERMARLRMAHHADCRGDWLFLDTDIVIQQDLRDVFQQPFDVAITIRDWAHLKPAGGFSERMPFNTGVVFSRSAQFWADAYQRMTQLPKDEQQWMGDQMVICDLVASGAFEVFRLSGLRYNFPPAIPTGDDEPGLNADLEAEAAIVHFKGPHRKPLMLRRIKQELLACV